MEEIISIIVNDQTYQLTVNHSTTLLSLLRDILGLTGTKEGCGSGDCGACTVLINGKAVNSCIYLAIDAHETEVITVEGLAKDSKLDLLQEAFINVGAVQCGFCTPGMLMSAKALLRECPNPTDNDIRYGMAGNLCRCTGYANIVKAIKLVAKNKAV